MRHPWIRTGFSPTLPPRPFCPGAVAAARPSAKKPMCCACSVECEPDGELRLDMIFEDGRIRSHPQMSAPQARRNRTPTPGDLPMITSLISRWIRWRC